MIKVRYKDNRYWSESYGWVTDPGLADIIQPSFPCQSGTGFILLQDARIRWDLIHKGHR